MTPPLHITDEYLDQLTSEELVALKARIEVRLSVPARPERAKAREAIIELAREHGIDLASLSNSPVRRTYRDPDNQLNVWGGRGRPPAWVKQKLAAGYTLNDLQAE